MRLSRLLVVLLLIAVPVFAQNREADVKTAFARAQHLKRGINVSHWFSQSASDYSAKHTETETTPEDIQTIAKLGFDNVRLSIDAVPLEQGFEGRGQYVDFVVRLDKAVDEILATGMAVQIDLHPEPAFKQAVKNTGEGVDRFVALWRLLAAHYANRDPERVFFEVMNEPEVTDGYRWAGIQARAAAAIREVAPKNTIIAAGANWSDIQDLLLLKPLEDGNVIYNFHDYDPHEFTHQGASWGPVYWMEEKAMPYPSSGEAAEAMMADRLAKISDPVARYRVKGYWLDHWDGHRIRLAIDSAGDWARANHVPLICNEFGVLRNVAEPADRLRWIHDMRTALEANGIGWAMWDYHNGFGVAVKDASGKSVVDYDTVEALGLKK